MTLAVANRKGNKILILLPYKNVHEDDRIFYVAALPRQVLKHKL